MGTAAIVGMGARLSAAIARRFGREGYSIAALARRAEPLRQEVDALTSAGVRARGYPVDAADAAALTATLAQAAVDLGAIEVLVYNAVGVHYKPLAELSGDEMAADLRVSVAGALTATQAVLPAMKACRTGTLLYTGGGFAFEPTPQLATVGAGKAGIRNLAFSLFADLEDTGVHAATVTICGVIKPGTPFDPDRIAEAYWKLHAQQAGAFEREVMFRG